MAENAFFFYGLLVTFVLGSMNRNNKLGRRNVPQLTVAAWVLLGLSVAGAAWLSFKALGTALGA